VPVFLGFCWWKLKATFPSNLPFITPAISICSPVCHSCQSWSHSGAYRPFLLQRWHVTFDLSNFFPL
jgi:ubiquitin-protein ligase